MHLVKFICSQLRYVTGLNRVNTCLYIYIYMCVYICIYMCVCVHINFQCFYIFCGIDASREMVMAKANHLHKHSDVSLSKVDPGDIIGLGSGLSLT